MTVDEFVKGYDKFTSPDAKTKYLKKHIVADYVPYKRKLDEADRIIQASSYQVIGEKKVFHVNTPARYMLTMIAVAQMYLDLEFDTMNMMLQFDMFEKRGINDMFQELIGVDYDRFLTLINMINDDLMINTRDLTSFIETKTEAFGAAIEQMVETIEENKTAIE